LVFALVHEHRTGQKVYRHPAVGEIEITFDVFELPGETGLFICTYSVEEGSESADKFALLASWAATRTFNTKHRADITADHPPAENAPPTTLND
jgi:MmyB-like transcription regulator ligand binding domain